jgi:transcriptional regulator with XRE-family HTH domain
MYITEEDLKQRLSKTSVLYKERERIKRRSIKDEDGIGESRLTHEDRKIIGILEETDTQKNIAELLGVSPQTVSNASRGLTTPSLGIDKELQKDVKEGREALSHRKQETDKQIQEQVITNLAAALGHVANNLHNTDAVEASKVATDMSRILERVSGNGGERGNKTAIIINVPTMREEKHYQTITV